MMRALVHGLAAVGRATITALVRRDWEVLVVDDRPDDRVRQVAAGFGVEVLDPERARSAVVDCDLYSPSPGVADSHPLFAVAARNGVAIRGELELAYLWEQQRPGGPRPMLGITGTDGKTTTTLMVEAILNAAGHRVVAAGNTDVPLIEAIDRDVDCFVVECTSFRLATTRECRTEGAAWLNLAPDHLDWHRDLGAYEAAKAKIFDQQRHGDVAVGVIGDAIVRERLATAVGRQVRVGIDEGEYRVSGADLMAPSGPLMAVSDLSRSLPHDITNSLVAAALCLETGLGDAAAVADGLSSFAGPAHRIEFIAEIDGVRWFNDSKATSPHACTTALRGFDSVVLIAGGRNKGLDLGSLVAEVARLRAVVAIGEAAGEIESIFADLVPVVRAESMSQAVARAGEAARRDDVVLLSPACASFDWYPDGGYAARGEDFSAEVRKRISGPRPAVRAVLPTPPGGHDQ
jgi:UDP-N-acetylmuramoylalanine--D-glutamate ligase